MDPVRNERRRRPEAARAGALEVGRGLLAEGGPRALTLKAVGARLGMSHANLIHHFGSAAGFQAQLAASLLEQLTRTVAALVERQGRGEVDTRAVVELVFDAYGARGMGALAAWSALNGEGRTAEGLAHELDALCGVIQPLIKGADRAARAREMIRLLTSLAFTDSLLGPPLSRMLGEEPGEARTQAVGVLERLQEDPADRGAPG